jgi:hypothetical protein
VDLFIYGRKPITVIYFQVALWLRVIQQGQPAGLNETGNQTANQLALLGDPSKLYVPSSK